MSKGAPVYRRLTTQVGLRLSWLAVEVRQTADYVFCHVVMRRGSTRRHGRRSRQQFRLESFARGRGLLAGCRRVVGPFPIGIGIKLNQASRFPFRFWHGNMQTIAMVAAASIVRRPILRSISRAIF